MRKGDLAYVSPFPLYAVSGQKRSADEPGEHDDFRRAGEHLHRADQRGHDELSSAFAHAAFHRQHDPREQAESGDVVWPHERLLHQAVEGVGHAGDGGGEGQAGPASRDGIGTESTQPEMQQHERAQRPRQRQEQVNQRAGVERHRVPLREEGEAAVVEWIPQWQFAAPEALAVIVRDGVAEDAEVAQDEAGRAKQHVRPRGEDQRGEQGSEADGGQEVGGVGVQWSVISVQYLEGVG